MQLLSRTDRSSMEVRAYAVRNTLEGTNKILGLHDNRVQIIRPSKSTASHDGLPPAWTDGRKITINGFVEPVYTALRDGWTEEDIFIVTALNYHELAHCFFMPRLDTDFAKRVRDAGYWQEFNILQDMHDETMFTGRFGPSKNYFARIAVEYFARTKHQIEDNYVLVAGRRFLPDDVRDYFLDNFAKPDLIPELDRISDAYVQTTFPRDEELMFNLIEEYHELLKELSPEGAGAIEQMSEHNADQAPEGGAMVPTTGTLLDEDDQDDAGSRAQRKASEKSEDGAEKPQGDGEGGDTDEESEGDRDDPERSSGGGPDGGQGHERPSLDNILDEAARQATIEVAQELGEKSDALDAAAQDYRVDIDPVAYREHSLDDDLGDAERKVSMALRRLKEEFDPGWYKGEDQGRLDFKRVVGHNITGRTDVFKRWDEGVNDVLDIEAVVAVDLSGSMASHTDATGKALWTIHTALKSHDAEVTVFGYNTDVFLLRQRGDKPEPFYREYGVGGGTSLTPALLEADKVFTASRRPLRMLFVLTDGGWWDKGDAHAILDDATYQTFIVGLGLDVEEYARIGSVEVAKTIHDISDLPSVARDIVTNVARERAVRQRTQGRA